MTESKYDLIKSWASVWTWYTKHPLDQKRFHEALYKVYQSVGPEIELGKLREAIELHASKLGDTPQGPARKDAIDRYMEQASVIACFLKNAQP